METEMETVVTLWVLCFKPSAAIASTNESAPPSTRKTCQLLGCHLGALGFTTHGVGARN